MNMNLFRRGRSATGKGASPFDSNRSQARIDDAKLNGQSPTLTGQDFNPLPYTTPGGSEPSSPSRKLANREEEEFSNSMSTQSQTQRPSSSRTLVPAKPSSPNGFTNNPNDSELYSLNHLSTFTFGAALASPSLSSPLAIDPLTRIRDDADSDDIQLYPDTTPRPSVVGSAQPNGHLPPNPKVMPLSSPSSSRLQSPPRDTSKDTEGESDAKSIQTYGHSSASASVSSLSRPSGSDSRSTSRLSTHSSTTPQTSGNDFTSSEDEYDTDDRHPLPPDYLDGNGGDFPQPRDTLYLSEEELDIYGDEDDADHEDLQDLQVPPTASTTRRGSAAIAIPYNSSDRAYNDHRERDSLSTLRRASKSLDELFSYSFAQASGTPLPARGSGGTAIASAAPSSVPESEVDLENVRKKSLPPIAPTANPISSGSGMDNFGIDASWMDFGLKGVVGIDNDEMIDIVGDSSLGRRPSDFNFRKGSTASTARRQSTLSADIIMRAIHTWNANDSKYQDLKRLWTYTQESDRLEPPLPTARERPSISSFFSPRSNTGNDTNVSLIAPFLEPNHLQKDKTKDKAAKNWKGMALDTEETWSNGWSGRFKVSRRNAAGADPTKLQQRLNFQYIRNHNGNDRTSAEGPPVTIHKHSKAVAFSIGRHYRTRSLHKGHSSSNLDKIARQTASQSATVTEAEKRKGGMILLAPRHVQVSYTSTTTTRKLESHGLLDDHSRRYAKDVERMKRDREREKAKAREREKDRGKDKERGRDKGNQTPKDKRESFGSKSYSGKGKEKEVEVPGEAWSLWEGSKGKNKLVESRESRSSGKPGSTSAEGANQQQGSPTSSRKTSETDYQLPSDSLPPSMSTSTSSSSSSIVHAFGSHSQTSVNTPATSSSQTSVADVAIGQDSTVTNENEDDEDYDSFDNRRRPPPRTTYREDYATLPPEAFELARQEQQSHRIFPWGRLKTQDKRNIFNTAYNPPWPITQPRFNSETRKFIVEDLNTSFQDVGLLPAIGEVKNSNSQKNRRKEPKTVRPPGNEARVDIFAEVPPDALYMLLPLWPGETDPSSAKRNPFTPPIIPVQERQYLLVYYKILPQPNHQRDGKTAKKRSRNSPTSSHDSLNRQDERYVLLNNFHISARVVSYQDLQGTSMRIPDVGLAVSGSLQDAYETMPHSTLFDDYVIGICNGRNYGFEFVPEGFEKMGLSQNVQNPRFAELNTDDDRSSIDTLTIPTPLGRAVMEMAWLGGMALTSFHRDPHWRG